MKKLLQVGCLGSIVLFGVLIVIGLLMDLPGNSEEAVVATQTAAASGFVEEIVCLEEGGPHVLQVESPSGETMAAGFLSIIDGTEDGELVTTAMRTRTEPQKVRSARVELHAGEPCYQLAAQTGIQGVRARVRLIRLPQQ